MGRSVTERSESRATGRRDRTPFQRLSSAYPAPVVRRWAHAHGIAVERTGGLPRWLYEMYARDAGESSAAPTGSRRAG